MFQLEAQKSWAKEKSKVWKQIDAQEHRESLGGQGQNTRKVAGSLVNSDKDEQALTAGAGKYR